VKALSSSPSTGGGGETVLCLIFLICESKADSSTYSFFQLCCGMLSQNMDQFSPHFFKQPRKMSAKILCYKHYKQQTSLQLLRLVSSRVGLVGSPCQVQREGRSCVHSSWSPLDTFFWIFCAKKEKGSQGTASLLPAFPTTLSLVGWVTLEAHRLRNT
jgi:hypothetical protein